MSIRLLEDLDLAIGEKLFINIPQLIKLPSANLQSI